MKDNALRFADAVSALVGRRKFLSWLGKGALLAAATVGVALTPNFVEAQPHAANVDCGDGTACPDNKPLCCTSACCPEGFPHLCPRSLRCYRTFAEAQNDCGNNYEICARGR